MSTKFESLMKTNIGPAQAAVLNVLEKSDHPLSRAQIANLTGLSLSSCCGRVNELIHLGMLVKIGKAHDPMTDRNVETLALAR